MEQEKITHCKGSNQLLFKKDLRSTNLELVMQRFNVILHTLYQLGLVLANSATDVWAHKESIEAAEDAEHLVGILSSSKLVTEASCNTSFDTINALIIPRNKKKRIEDENYKAFEWCLGTT